MHEAWGGSMGWKNEYASLNRLFKISYSCTELLSSRWTLLKNEWKIFFIHEISNCFYICDAWITFDSFYFVGSYGTGFVERPGTHWNWDEHLEERWSEAVHRPYGKVGGEARNDFDRSREKARGCHTKLVARVRNYFWNFVLQIVSLFAKIAM